MSSQTSSKKVTRQDLSEAAEKYKNWGKWGPDDEIGTLNYTTPEDIVAATRLVQEGQGDLACAQFRPHRSAGRQEQVSGDGPHQSDPHHDPHRHRRLFGRARQARHPRRRRHGDHAAAVRHAVGRPRPRLLRGLHVERLRLPRGDVGRRAEVRHREDQEQDGRPRRAARRRALQGHGLARRRLRHHLRGSRRCRQEAGRRGQARRLRHRAHRPDGALPQGRQLGRLSGRRRAGLRLRDARVDQAHRARRARQRHLGLRGAARTKPRAASTSPGTGSPSRSWA